MEQSPSEADSHSASQEISAFNEAVFTRVRYHSQF